MTKPAPKRLRLKRSASTKPKPEPRRVAPPVANWKPDSKAVSIRDLMQASEDLKGNYTGETKGNRRKHPWETVATEYIEGFLTDPEDPESERRYATLKELGEIYGIGIYQMKERSKIDQWSKKRQQFQMLEAQRRMNLRKITVLGKSLEFDDNAHKASEMGMQLVRIRLGEIAQEVKARQNLREVAMVKLATGEKFERKDLYTAVNPREMESLAKAMSAFQEIGMKALGTDVIRHEITGMDTNVYVDQSTHKTQNNLSIQSEMRKDDPERLASILTSLQDANLLPDVVDNILGGEEIVDEGEIPQDVANIPGLDDTDENQQKTA